MSSPSFPPHSPKSSDSEIFHVGDSTATTIELHQSALMRRDFHFSYFSSLALCGEDLQLSTSYDFDLETNEVGGFYLK